MAAWRNEISLPVLKTISTLEEKFHISARPCNILYISKYYNCWVIIMGYSCKHELYRKINMYFLVKKFVTYYTPISP